MLKAGIQNGDGDGRRGEQCTVPGRNDIVCDILMSALLHQCTCRCYVQ